MNLVVRSTSVPTADRLPLPIAALNADAADRLPLWAGQSAGRLNALPWAADVVRDTVREARDLLQRILPERVTLT